MQNNIVLFSMDKSEFSSIIKNAIQSELSKKKEKELMNFKETCEFLGIHTSTLNKWKSENKVPFKKLGKRIFFNREDVTKSLKDSNYSKLNQLKSGI